MNKLPEEHEPHSYLNWESSNLKSNQFDNQSTIKMTSNVQLRLCSWILKFWIDEENFHYTWVYLLWRIIWSNRQYVASSLKILKSTSLYRSFETYSQRKAFPNFSWQLLRRLIQQQSFCFDKRWIDVWDVSLIWTCQSGTLLWVVILIAIVTPYFSPLLAFPTILMDYYNSDNSRCLIFNIPKKNYLNQPTL